MVATYTYDPWGTPTGIYSASGTAISQTASNVAAYNPFRYRGYRYDGDTRLYYLKSRYYDPASGRFINADGYASTGQGLSGHNMFSYCGNNSINRKDDEGCFWEAIAAAAAIGGIFGGLGAIIDGEDFGGIIKETLYGAAAGAGLTFVIITNEEYALVVAGLGSAAIFIMGQDSNEKLDSFGLLKATLLGFAGQLASGDFGRELFFNITDVMVDVVRTLAPEPTAPQSTTRTPRIQSSQEAARHEHARRRYYLSQIYKRHMRFRARNFERRTNARLY